MHQAGGQVCLPFLLNIPFFTIHSPIIFEISPKFSFINVIEAVIGQNSDLRKNDGGGPKILV